MLLSNVDTYRNLHALDGEDEVVKAAWFKNIGAMGTMTAVFTVMFNIFNSMLITYTYESFKVKAWLISIIFFLQTIILVITNFKFDEITQKAISVLLIVVVFTAIMVPSFISISN